MNFQKFWNDDNNFGSCRTTEQFCKVSWDTCKKEVLKILNKTEKYKIIEAGKVELDVDFQYIRNEIEKL